MRTLLLPGVAAEIGTKPSLMVICSYLERERDGLPPLGGLHSHEEKPVWKFLRPFAGWVSSARHIKNFYANPRDGAYLQAMIERFLKTNGITTALDVVVDTGLEHKAALDAVDHRKLYESDLSSPIYDRDEVFQKLRRGEYGSVFLVFSDAIGLGCESVIKLAADHVPDHVWGVNGRQRAFRLDASNRRALAVRRFLARYRIVDFLLAIGMVILAAGCALADKIQGVKVYDARQG